MNKHLGTKRETRRTSWRNRLVIACAALGALAAAGPATAGPGTLRVDDDKLQCPEAQFASIHAAVAAAEPGDTVKVCPGFYNEFVTIPKTLELDGAGPDPRERTGDPTEEAVVRSFNLLASRTVVKGFTIQSELQTSRLFSGYRIERNLIQLRLRLDSSGAETTRARHNAFIGVFGSQITCGSGGGCPNSIIEQNFLAGRGAQIQVTNSTDVDIEHNMILDSLTASAISLSRVDNVRVRQNHIERAFNIGIFFSNSIRVDITGNRIEGVVGGHGIATVSTSDVLVAHNTVTGAQFDGIFLFLLSSSRIEHNQLERNGRDGINLLDVRDSLIAHNKSDENGSDGIDAGSRSMSNTIEHNRMRRNVEHDCHDDSVGPNNPPALVANIWRDNNGLTENRPGLCRGNDD